jgi:hypothetical protein
MELEMFCEYSELLEEINILLSENKIKQVASKLSLLSTKLGDRMNLFSEAILTKNDTNPLHQVELDFQRHLE